MPYFQAIPAGNITFEYGCMTHFHLLYILSFIVAMEADCSYDVYVWLQGQILYPRNCIFPSRSAV